MGDLNGDLADFPVLAKLIEEEGWNDLGAIADQWGQPRCAPTCWPNVCEASRRDYILANGLAFCRVEKFTVCPGDFDNHAVLQVAVRLGSQQDQATIHKAHKSLMRNTKRPGRILATKKPR